MSSQPRCPSCKCEVHTRTRFAPFCSERCKLVDLQKWLGGVYAIPGRPVDVGVTVDDEAAES